MKALPATKTPLEYFLSLKYPMEVVEDDGAWVASIPDLPGCNAFGDTLQEAVANLERTKKLWIESQYEINAEIPEPTEEEDFSGKFILRIPKTLHRSLAYQAQKQGVSLNHYASYLLAERHPLQTLQRTLDRRAFLRHEAPVWVHQHETPQRHYLLVGTKFPGDVSAVTLLSKPAPRGVMKVPQTLEEQYNPTHANR